MKKRILSALLALVMVLALLPATAFAVEYTTNTGDPDDVPYTDSQGNTHHFYEVVNNRVSTVTVQRAAQSDPTTGRVQGKWYWLDNKTNKDTYTYYEATTGLVAGTSGSGQWYPSVEAYTNDTANGDRVKGAFTLLDTTAIRDLTSYKDSSLTICLNGQNVSLNVPTVITQLRLTNGGTGWFPAAQGTVAAITTNRGTYDGGTDATKTGLTITAEDISFGKITTVGRANTLNLTNCTVAGIEMDGTTVANAAGTSTSYNAQRVTMTGGSITDAVTLTGDGSTISLTGVNATDQDITVTSNGGSISVAGASVVDDITSTARTSTGNYPSVSVTGGTVGDITRTPNTAPNASDNGITITVSGGSTTADAINAAAGRNTIKVSSATVDTITTSAGTLNIDGSYTKTGLITINNTTDTNGMTLSVGSGSTNLNIGGITSTSTRLKINSWPTNRDNYFGEVNLGTYAGHGVKGGTFEGINNYGTVGCLGWFDTSLQYRVKSGANAYKLYGKTELGQAISDLGTTAANQTSAIIILGQAGGAGYIEVMNGSTPWGKVYFSADSSIILPSEINSVKINSWIGPNGTPVAPGTAQAVLYPGDTGHVTINATDVAQDVTKILNATVAPNTVNNADIRVSFKEGTTNISLSGAIQAGAGGLATIRLNLTTDVIDTAGAPVVLQNVPVVYNVGDKTLKFDDWAEVGNKKYGASIVNGALRLANGTTYTVSNGGLAVSASNLGLWKDGVGGKSPIVVTFGGTLSSWRQDQKDALAAQLNGAGCGFVIGTNKAMAEAINAAQATITSETTVDSLVQRAQSYVWTNGNSYLNNNGQNNGLGQGDGSLTKHSGSISKPGEFSADATTIQSNYSKAYIVPYLVMNVTDYNQNGTLTATLTPYYRVDVSGAAYSATEYYTVQTGRALSALTGEMKC